LQLKNSILEPEKKNTPKPCKSKKKNRVLLGKNNLKLLQRCRPYVQEKFVESNAPPPEMLLKIQLQKTYCPPSHKRLFAKPKEPKVNTKIPAPVMSSRYKNSKYSQEGRYNKGNDAIPQQLP